jgi:hypothetical protein
VQPVGDEEGLGARWERADVLGDALEHDVVDRDDSPRRSRLERRQHRRGAVAGELLLDVDASTQEVDAGNEQTQGFSLAKAGAGGEQDQMQGAGQPLHRPTEGDQNEEADKPSEEPRPRWAASAASPNPDDNASDERCKGEQAHQVGFHRLSLGSAAPPLLCSVGATALTHFATVSQLRLVPPIVGLAAVIAAAMLLFWPLDEPGVAGTALTPHYREFGWYSYSPLPDHPSVADFRKAGIPVPQDTVHRRQLEAGASGGVGVVGMGFWWLSRRRQHLVL